MYEKKYKNRIYDATNKAKKLKARVNNNNNNNKLI